MCATVSKLLKRRAGKRKRQVRREVHLAGISGLAFVPLEGNEKVPLPWTSPDQPKVSAVHI